MLKKILSLTVIFSSLFVTSAFAEVAEETAYILNSFLFLVSGFLVMLMALGFCLLESGMVTSKSVSAIAAKNIGLYSISGIMFWLVGYNLAYGIPEGGYIGSFTTWTDGSALLMVIQPAQTGFSKWFSVLPLLQLSQEL
jgi:Amt family ammonium transporter